MRTQTHHLNKTNPMSVKNAISHNASLNITGLGLPAVIVLSQLTSSYWSLPPLAAMMMLTALAAVWLDGIVTVIGLRRGLEEVNPVINGLQSLVGPGWGLLLSRILLTSLVLAIAVAFQNLYVLTFIALAFTLLTISNIAQLTHYGSSLI